MSAFGKTIVRSINGSLGRFLAILAIVALGCGFYAGLQMCGPDMRAAADEFYDGTNLYDLRVVSTLGFGINDVARIEGIEGVEHAMGAASCDAMARVGEDQLVVRVSSLDVGLANDAEAVDANVILSDDGRYLNRVFLREGRWPSSKNECVMSDDNPLHEVGIGDHIELMYGAQDLDDVVRSKRLAVVGLVSYSGYPYTGNFGSTTLGSGVIGQYVYVAPSAFVEDVTFTEIYASVEGAHGLENASDEYWNVVGAVREGIEHEEERLAAARFNDVRGDAQHKLDEKRADFEKERKDATEELDDAKQKLDDAKRELDDAQREIDSGEAEYEQGLQTLADSRVEAAQQIADAQRTIDDGRRELDKRSAELEAGRRELEEGTRSYEQGVAQVLEQTGTSSLEEAKAKLEEGKRQADEGVAQLNDSLDAANQLIERRGALEAGETQFLQAVGGMGIPASSVSEARGILATQLQQLEDAGAPDEQIEPVRSALATADELIEGRAQLEGARAQFLSGIAQAGITATDEADAKAKLEARLPEAQAAQAQAQEGLDGVAKLESAAEELESNRVRIEDGERQIADGRASLDAGQEELTTRRADAERELTEGQQRLNDARSELNAGKTKLANGTKEYESSLETYREERKKANKEFKKAEKKLADAQSDIDEIEMPELYVLDRSQNEGAATYDADTRRMDSIADVFPLMFFLVAALVALTTMTRMVEDDRIEMGTYKALGYSTARIATKYLAYAGLAGVGGAVVGILALSQLLPFIVTMAYSIIYTVPIHPFPMPVDLSIALTSGGLGVGVTLLATWAAVVSSLRETPATLMLPRAPAAGKRILLEHIAPIWRRLSFSWKVTFRNLFRYKRRLAMTVVGISGCTALLLVGFGLHDSIWDIIDCQFGPIIHYDVTVRLDEDATEHDLNEVISYVEKTGKVHSIVRAYQSNMQVGSNAANETLLVQVVVPEEKKSLEQAVTLRDRVTHEPFEVDDNAVIVTEKIALKYGLEVGSEVRLYEQDAIGNAKGEGTPLRVTAIAENYVGNYVYMGEAAWHEVDDAMPTYPTIFAQTDLADDERDAFAANLRDRDDVSTVSYAEESINTYRTMLSVVDSVVVLLIASAGALAFIVLYNLTNINIAERVREIASLKVLGFTRGEVYAYIFREILLLAIMGDALGMAFGTWLEHFVVVTAEVDYVMFGRTIHVLSYGYSFALTLVFCVLIMFGMRRKLDKVNMVESLKSVD
ncbi:MAG: FtsX-like permease family protein [Atopobiaceae bacterium]|nr:FtsX-like permease family protein [Atopobiaceae bacterium]